MFFSLVFSRFFPLSRHLAWGVSLYVVCKLCGSYAYVLLRVNRLPSALSYGVFVAVEVVFTLLIAIPAARQHRKSLTSKSLTTHARTSFHPACQLLIASLSLLCSFGLLLVFMFEIYILQIPWRVCSWRASSPVFPLLSSSFTSSIALHLS